MRNVLQFQGRRVFLVTEVFSEKRAAAAAIHSDILSVIRKPLPLLLSSVLSNSCQPNNHPAVIEHEGGGVSHFKVASIYRDQPMPCRHKGNKQVLLSAASSIPSQPLRTTIISQLPPLKWKKVPLKSSCMKIKCIYTCSAGTSVAHCSAKKIPPFIPKRRL